MRTITQGCGRYQIHGSGWSEPLTRGIDNSFNEEPPTYHGTWIGDTKGYAGATLGPVVNLGFTSTFRSGLARATVL